MKNIIEINMDELKEKYNKYPIGTILACENEDKIYIYVSNPSSINNPTWKQLTSEYELAQKLRELSVVDKVKMLTKCRIDLFENETDLEICPVCGNTIFENIRTDSSLYIVPNGSIKIICCTNCGILKVSERCMQFRKIGRI